MAGLTLTQVDIIVSWCEQDNYIGAIKDFRNFTGAGLKLAKDEVRGTGPRRRPNEVRQHLIDNWLVTTGDRQLAIVQEMRKLTARMEELVAQFAELADSADAQERASVSVETAPTPTLGLGVRVKIISPDGDEIDNEGEIGVIVSIDPMDHDLHWQVEFVEDDDYSYHQWYRPSELEVIA